MGHVVGRQGKAAGITLDHKQQDDVVQTGQGEIHFEALSAIAPGRRGADRQLGLPAFQTYHATRLHPD